VANNGGNSAARVAAPGSLANSMLLTRIATLGQGRMPPLGSTLVDTPAVSLFSSWITNDLPSYLTFSHWQVAHFGSTSAPGSAPDADPDGDGASNRLEYLTGTDPQAALSAWSIALQPDFESMSIVFPQIANRGFEVQASADLSGSAPWQALNVPENAPFFSVSNRVSVVTDGSFGTSRFYRVLVYEP
jgi:hypothetical protein